MTKTDFVSNLGDWNLFEIWCLGFAASISLCSFAPRLTGVARVAIDARPSFPVAVHAPLHIVSIHHLHRSITRTGKTMAGSTIYLAPDVNPVGKNNVFWKFIHPLPWNFFIIFYIPHHLYCLGPLTDRIGGVASPAEFNIRNSCDTIFLHVSMAKVAVQLGDFLMVNMIEADRLINGCASKDWKDGKEERFRLDSEAMPRNGCEKKNQGNCHEKANLLFHIFSLFVSP
jgi:hypothetical protein